MRTAVTVVLALCGLTFGVGVSPADEAGPARAECKLAGLRYIGTAASKGRVCFTLSPNSRSMKEYALEPCPAVQDIVAIGRIAKRTALKANGTFTARTSKLAIGSSGDLGSLEWMNITFSGRVQGARASGSLVLKGSSSKKTFRCGWSARRAG